MLCSKRAKPPDRLGLLGSSYVMKHLRLVLILAFVASVAAACGSSSSAPTTVPNDAVAVVGGNTITKDQFNQVLDQAKRSYVAQHKPFPTPGSQTYGAASPTFSATPPAGVTLSGTVTCTTVNGGTAIGPTLGAGSYNLDGTSCSGSSSRQQS